MHKILHFTKELFEQIQLKQTPCIHVHKRWTNISSKLIWFLVCLGGNVRWKSNLTNFFGNLLHQPKTDWLSFHLLFKQNGFVTSPFFKFFLLGWLLERICTLQIWGFNEQKLFVFVQKSFVTCFTYLYNVVNVR